MAAPQLAKLTPPRLGKVYLRTRLFKQLDAARKDHPVIWISAPAGSGKTTLVTSYLEQQKIKPLWYAVDEGDADPASFFYYLGLLGKQAAPRKKQALPLLTPEYLLGLPTFTRNFFRDFFSRIKPPGVIVFDNYQEAPDDAAMHELLQIALAELPPQLQLIFVSRTEPPGAYSRSRASGTLAVISPSELRLTLEECTSITRLHEQGDTHSAELITQLHQQTEGWTAGLILMLEGAGNMTVPDNLRHTEPQLLFDYFATELFDHTDEDTHTFLMKTGVLPFFTEHHAQQLTGLAHTQQILNRLIKRNYFITAHPGERIHYQYHPLFQQYLHSRAASLLSAAQQTALYEQAAGILVETDSIPEAVELYLKAHHIEKAVTVILQNTMPFMLSGRQVTLLNMIQSLPDELKNQHPWLLYWQGVCLSTSIPLAGLPMLETAFPMFEQANDAAGAYLTIAAAFDAIFYSQEDQHPHDIWIERLRQLQKRHPEYPNEQIEIQVIQSTMSAIFWRQPSNPMVEENLQKADFISRKTTDLGVKIRLLGILMYLNFGDLNLASSYLAQLDAILYKHADVPPISRLMSGMATTYIHNYKAQQDESIKTVTQLLDIADNSGIHILDNLILGAGIDAALSKNDFTLASAWMGRLLDNLKHLPVNNDTAHLEFFRACIAWRENNFDNALIRIQNSLDIVTQNGAMIPMILVNYAMSAVMLALGENEKARHHAEECLRLAHGTYFINRMSYMLAIVEAYYAIDKDLTYAIKRLQTAFGLGKQHGYLQSIEFYNPKILTRLCAVALQHQLEPDYTLKVIRHCHLIPDTAEQIEAWPYPMKVYTLGRFSLLLDDEKQDLSGKSAARPLALLKCLIALGGRDVAQEKLIEALWPDMDGDAGSKAFHTNLYRLRKLIQHDEAIILKDGLLTLDPRYVWVDAWTLERSLSQLEQACEQNKPADEVETLASQVTHYNKGAFLQQDKDPVWALAYRERLQLRVQRALISLGQYWQAQTQTDKAIAVFERLLDLDRLLEPAYQQLMQLFIGEGRHAEAAAIYERCRKVLSTALGVMPSAQTLALLQTIPRN